MGQSLGDQFQKNINRKGFNEQILIMPSGYHDSRASNEIFGTTENVTIVERNLATIPPTENFKALADLFRKEEVNPAGGWYLVKEQRDWLRDILIRKIQNLHENDQKEIDILEAGIASFNHHFSYLVILKEVIEALGYEDLILNVTVTDKAFFPLWSIDEIEKSSIEKLREKKSISVFNYEIPLQESFIDFLETHELLTYDRIRVKSIQYDLTDHLNTHKLGIYDIITEHFITSVIDNVSLEKDIRKSYANLLKTNGYLFCASGKTPHIHHQAFDDFLDIHEECGLMQTSDRINVWDPYGMRGEDLLLLLEDQEIKTRFDNGLFAFQKK
jgi:hypothetical protein